jgi:hypothetical protein
VMKENVTTLALDEPKPLVRQLFDLTLQHGAALLARYSSQEMAATPCFTRKPIYRSVPIRDRE